MNPIIFAKTVTTLFTKPAAINDLLNHSLWFVVRFFIISIFFVSLIDTYVLLTTTFPDWMSDFRKDIATGVEHYPEDLTVHWDGQRLTTSPNQLIAIPYPKHTLLDKEGLPPTFAVLATQEETLEPEVAVKLYDQRALLYLTQKNLYVNSPSLSADRWSELPLLEVPGFEQPFSIDKSSAPQVAEAVTNNLEQTVVDGWLFIGLAMFIFLLLSKTWITAWYSLIAWLFFKFYSGKMRYKQLLKLTLFLVVIAQTITSISSALYTQTNTTYLFGLSYLILFFIFFTQLRYRRV